MRARAVVGAVVAAWLLVPACAGAATVTISADAGPAANSYVRFRAAPGERNRVTVQLRKKTLVIADHGVEQLRFHELKPFGRCDRIGPRTLVCPRIPVIALLRDGDDSFVASPGGHGRDHRRTHPLALAEDYTDTEGAIVETTIAIAGSGDDLVRGSRFRDLVLPGSGRDRVDGRGGGDEIRLGDDEVPDHLAGGPGIDSVDFGLSRVPVGVDLSSHRALMGDTWDRVRGFERVHGGPKHDLIHGSATGDALYGEGGRDEIHGGGGNDLLAGDSPIATKAFPNELWGARGADVIDSRGYAQPPPPANAHLTSRVHCGPGHDRELGETDDLVGRSCEAAVLRLQQSPGEEVPLYGVTSTVWPVARDADSVTYEVACPPVTILPNAGCTPSIVLEAPPIGGEAPDTLYGASDSVSMEPGERGPVRVELNEMGKQALANRQPIDVHLQEDVDSGNASPGWRLEAGWEQVLRR